MKLRLQRFWKDEEGQSTTEYILILAVVVMIAMKFKDQVGRLIAGQVDRLGGQLNDFNSGDL